MKRLFIAIVSLFSVSLLSLAAPLQALHAQNIVIPTTSPAPTGPWWNQTTKQFSSKIQQAPPQEIFGERYTYAQINWILNSLYMILDPIAGKSNDEITTMFKIISQMLQAGITPSPSHYAALGIPGIFLGFANQIYANPPASGVDSVNQTLAHFNLVRPAFAQTTGYGFTAANGIQTMWAASRNMAFLVIILLLIVAGFMIMFRVKINPQTVISIQLMIPRLIITLIAITFSYAIAGLAIDLVYLLLGFMISILTTTGAIGGGKTAVDIFNWFAAPTYYKVVLIFIQPLLMVTVLGGIISLIASVVTPLGLTAGGLFVLISIMIVAFFGWLLIKVWWMMVKTYLMLMFTIIAGPWQILLGLIPSGDPKSSMGFGPWLRTILSQVSVFLVVPLMFILICYFWGGPIIGSFSAFTIFGNPIGTVNQGGGNYPSFPLFGSQGGLFGFVVGYAILSLIPKIATMIQEAIKAPAFKYGTAFGEALGGAVMGANYFSNKRMTAANITGESHGRGSPDWVLAQKEIASMKTLQDIAKSTKGI